MLKRLLYDIKKQGYNAEIRQNFIYCQCPKPTKIRLNGRLVDEKPQKKINKLIDVGLTVRFGVSVLAYDFTKESFKVRIREIP